MSFSIFFPPPSRLTRTSTHLLLAPAQQRSVVTTINPARQPPAQAAGSGRSPCCSSAAMCVRLWAGWRAARRSASPSHPERCLDRARCQERGANRAHPANRGGSMAGLLIPCVSVSPSSPVRFFHPLSGAEFNSTVGGSVQKRERLHEALPSAGNFKVQPRACYQLACTLW